MCNYVLVYKGNQFYTSQNLYLGCANLTQRLQDARVMTLEDAEITFGLMANPTEWEIWSVRTGIVLDKKSERHSIRCRINILKSELSKLQKELE